MGLVAATNFAPEATTKAINYELLANNSSDGDPRKIPYGSRVVFPDMECVAVDTGPGVVNRKSARDRTRTSAQEGALVIDRFFETKQEAVAWMRTHPKLITVRVITPDAVAKQKSAEPNQAPLQLASEAAKH